MTAATGILNDTKKVLGLDPDYKAFDIDILMHINTAFVSLNQLGVGPQEGFQIEDETAEWEDYLLNDPNLNSVKTYIYLKVRLYFDPPETSYAQTARQKQIEELEWRLNVYREGRDNP